MRLVRSFAKILLTVLLLWMITFWMVRDLTPDPGSALSGFYADAATRHYLEAMLGLDRSFPIALVDSIGRAVRLDFGVSLRTHRPVLADIWGPARITASLALAVAAAATLVTYSGIVLGLLRNTGLSVQWTVASAALSAIPGYILALLGSPWLIPRSADGDHRVVALVLPTLVLLLPLLPYSFTAGLRMAREIRSLPWFETFSAFGFAPLHVVATHGQRWLLRGGLNVAITVFLIAFTGSVAVEQVCGLTGLGTMMLDAIDARDLPVVLMITALTGSLASMLVLMRTTLEGVADA